MPFDNFTPAQRRAWIAAMSLTTLRAVLAPTMIALAATHAPAWTLVAVMATAFTSDVFDGVIARRGNAVTPVLRRADSIVDITFYLAVAWTTWEWFRPLLLAVRYGILALILGEIVSNGLALLRFRRDASYHTRGSRTWGLSLFVAMIGVFGFRSGALLPIAIVLGLLAQSESLAITLILPAWQTDVRSVVAAWRIRAAATR